MVFFLKNKRNTSHSRILDTEADDRMQTKFLQLRPEQKSVSKIKKYRQLEAVTLKDNTSNRKYGHVLIANEAAERRREAGEAAAL